MRWEAELKVGVLVLAGAVLLVILLTMASDMVVGVPGRDMTLYFPRLNALKKGAWVHLNGIAVGKVTEIHLDPSGYAVVQARVNSPVPLREGLSARLGTLGFVGEAYVELINGPQDAPLFTAWDKPVYGQSAADPWELLDRLEEGLNATIALIGDLKGTLSRTEEEIQATATQVRESVAQSSRQLEAIATDFRAIQAQTIQAVGLLQKQVPEAAADARRTTQALRETLDRLDRRTQALAEAAQQWLSTSQADVQAIRKESLEAIEALRETLQAVQTQIAALRTSYTQTAATIDTAAQSAQTQIDTTLQTIQQTAQTAETVLRRIDRLSASIEAGSGTLGRLFVEDRLTGELESTLAEARAAAGEVRTFTRRVREWTRPSVDPVDLGATFSYDFGRNAGQEEIGIVLRRDPRRWVFGAVRIRGSKNLWSLTFAQKLGPLWARIGFLESQPAIGAEWHPGETLTLRADLVDVARPLRRSNTWQLPRLDAEAIVRPVRRLGLVFGARNLLDDDRAFLIGLRAGEIP